MHHLPLHKITAWPSGDAWIFMDTKKTATSSHKFADSIKSCWTTKDILPPADHNTIWSNGCKIRKTTSNMDYVIKLTCNWWAVPTTIFVAPWNHGSISQQCSKSCVGSNHCSHRRLLDCIFNLGSGGQEPRVRQPVSLWSVSVLAVNNTNNWLVDWIELNWIVWWQRYLKSDNLYDNYS